MATVIILLVMLTVLLGAAAYGLISGSKTLQNNIEKLEVEDRLEEAAQGVLNNIVSTTSLATQTYNVPAPDNLAAPAVPSWITANAQTPRGVKFLYCPFSNISGSGSTITTPSGSYAVTIGTLYSGSQNYVTASASRPSNTSNALAIIVAPGPNQTTTPDCQNISSTGTLAGAQVRVITEAEVQSRAQVIASAGSEYYVASTSSGDSSGNNSSNPIDLANVLTYASQYRPQAVKINLAVGTYALDQTNISESRIYRPLTTVMNHSIYFAGNSQANTFLQSSATPTFTYYMLGNALYQNISFPAVDNLSLLPQAYNLSNLIMDNSAVQYVTISNNGHVYLLGLTNLSGSDSTNTTGANSSRVVDGGQYYWGGTVIFPATSFMVPSFFYALHNLGQIIIASGTNFVYTGAEAHIPPVIGGSEWIDEGTFTQMISNGTSFLMNSFTDSRVILSGATFNSLYSPVFAPLNSLTALDRATNFNINTVGTTVSQLIRGSGGELDITNSTLGSTTSSTLRANPTSLQVNSNVGSGSVPTGWRSELYELGGGTTGGWTGGILTGTSTTACSTASTSNNTYHLTNDSPTANATVFLPQGTNSYEPLVILNRAGWTCTHS